MATQPSKKKIEYLKTKLNELAVADEQSSLALFHLCKAIGTELQQPVFQYCAFKLGEATFGAMLTSTQTSSIINAVNQSGDPTTVVDAALGNLNVLIGGYIDGLVTALDSNNEKRQAVKLGCCTYDSEATPNLTQSQCAQLNGTWDSLHPDCTYKKGPINPKAGAKA